VSVAQSHWRLFACRFCLVCLRKYLINKNHFFYNFYFTFAFFCTPAKASSSKLLLPVTSAATTTTTANFLLIARNYEFAFAQEMRN